MKAYSLKLRFILVQTTILFAAVALLGAAIAAVADRQLAAESRAALQSAARLAANLVEKDLSRALTDATLFAENAALRDALAGADWIEASRELTRILAIHDADALALADADGVTRAQAERTADGSVRALSAVETGGPLHLSGAFQEAVFKRRPAARIEGLAPGALAAVAIAPFQGPGGPDGFLRLVYRIDDRFVRRLKEVSGVDLEIVRRGELTATTLKERKRSAQIAAGLRPFDADGLTEEYMTLEFPLPGRPSAATMIAARERTPYRNTRKLNALLIAFVSAGVFVAAALAAGGAAGRFARPLHRLTDGVREIERGDLTARVAPEGGPELAHLAGAFNQMAETLQKRSAELEENQRQVRQSAKLAGIGELAAGVAHEVGNPLAAISGYVQLLRNRLGDDGKSAHYLDEVAREAGYIDATIRELLDFARPSDEAPAPFSVRDVLEEAARIAAFHPELKKCDIRTSFERDDITVLARRQEFLQAVLNLIVNAGQSMKNGGPVDVRAEAPNGPDGALARVIVRDAGEGIPPDRLSRVFDPFYTTKAGGAGLGLAVTYRIVERCGGRITIHSREKKGTEAVIETPLHRSGPGPAELPS